MDQQEPAPRDERRVDQLLAPFVRDSSLWPVTLVVVLSLVAFGTALLVLAIGDRNVSALAAVAILLLVSVDAVRSDVRRRRLGPVSGLILAFWLLSALAAFGARLLGLG